MYMGIEYLKENEFINTSSQTSMCKLKYSSLTYISLYDCINMCSHWYCMYIYEHDIYTYEHWYSIYIGISYSRMPRDSTID